MTLCYLRINIEQKLRNKDLDLYVAKTNVKISKELQEEYCVEAIEKMRDNGVDLYVKPSDSLNR